MSRETNDTRSEKQVGPKRVIDLNDEELERVVGGTSDTKLATDLPIERVEAGSTNSYGHFTQMAWK